MNEENKFEISNPNQVIILDGLFFIRDKEFKNNSDIVKQTFHDLYTNISFN